MMAEKLEEEKSRIKKQLGQKVRPHRPAEKVLEIAVALAEERLEAMEAQIENLKWQLGFLGKLKPADIEQDKKS